MSQVRNEQMELVGISVNTSGKVIADLRRRNKLNRCIDKLKKDYSQGYPKLMFVVAKKIVPLFKKAFPAHEIRARITFNS